jgi:hypothetical protein
MTADDPIPGRSAELAVASVRTARKKLKPQASASPRLSDAETTVAYLQYALPDVRVISPLAVYLLNLTIQAITEEIDAAKQPGQPERQQLPS